MARTVRDLLVALRGVAYTPRISTVVVAGLTDTIILKNDPSRVAFILVNAGPIDCVGLPLVAPAVGTTGFKIANGGGGPGGPGAGGGGHAASRGGRGGGS